MSLALEPWGYGVKARSQTEGEGRDHEHTVERAGERIPIKASPVALMQRVPSSETAFDGF